jgi:hypothetical protein
VLVAQAVRCWTTAMVLHPAGHSLCWVRDTILGLVGCLPFVV